MCDSQHYVSNQVPDHSKRQYLGLVSLNSLLRGCIIDNPAVLCSSVHTIAHGNVEDMEELHRFGRAENICKTRAMFNFIWRCKFFRDMMVVDMQIFTITTVKTSNPCFICSVCMPWALYIYMTFYTFYTDSQTSRT